jgi:hypothetical protein
LYPKTNKQKKTAPDPIEKTSTGIDTDGYLLLTSGEEGRKEGRGGQGGVCVLSIKIKPTGSRASAAAVATVLLLLHVHPLHVTIVWSKVPRQEKCH